MRTSDRDAPGLWYDGFGWRRSEVGPGCRMIGVAHSALLAAMVSGCTSDPTQLLVTVDTDLRSSDVRFDVIVRRGNVSIPPSTRPDFSFRWSPAGSPSRGVRLPASFGVLPPDDAPRNDAVTVAVTASTEGLSPPVSVRRVLTTQFVPNGTSAFRVFLSAACAQSDARCRSRSPCTVQAFCEESGQTCNEHGQCVQTTSCPAGGSLCGDRCVDVQTDATHCGQCDRICGSTEVCAAGMCRSGCPASWNTCGGLCVDPQVDNSNCGGCGRSCGRSMTCVMGACTCPGGLTACGGSCVDTRSDPSHCGVCGTRCGTGTSCVGGTCMILCGGGMTICAGACVDPSSDAQHCGRCFGACGVGESCVGGMCRSTCTVGRSSCSGVCTDLANDARNCGSCGVVCSAGFACSAGACRRVCPTGTVDCGTSCASLSIDPMHCGACGNRCPVAQTCALGTCGATCPPGTSLCSGACVNTLSDLNHCGGCGAACSAGSMCVRGACVTPPLGCSLASYGGHTYAVCGTPVTWFQARDACAAWGGSLVVIESSAENLWLQTSAPGTRWIAFSDEGAEGAWTWRSGTSSYVAWCAGEPNNNCCYGPYAGCPGGTSTGQNCAVTNAGCMGGAGWDDQHCCWMNPYVCERP